VTLPDSLVHEAILTAADGTRFAIQSEHVRGEPRAYWLIRRDPGEQSFVRDGHANYDEVYRKDTAMRQLRRRVKEYDEVCAALGRDASTRP
jgi:hypothetical protein